MHFSRFVSALTGSMVAVAVLATAPLAAQTVAGHTSPLEFLGFRPGASLTEIAANVRALDGGTLRCDRARSDRRVTECRGSVTDPEAGGTVQVWLSAIDSVAAVLTVSGDVAPDQLDRWRNTLERNYGRVDARVQGPQWMMQWVRQGRMARLTWKVQRQERIASVSLVDGHVLDGWGRERRRARGGE
ncbi:MAG TPA: hypothetical protein VFU00_08225 [Gemmatimonadales bacterium]|nr:hypothetical protein [Gemmatimonadales bacterium]